jgi:hypothetical protein
MSAMAAWIPMFALPNISLEEAIEVDGVALASMADNRIQELVNKHESFATYLDSFRSEFGLHLQPSIIIRRDDTTELYRSVEALSGFRDAIALSVVPYAWATYLRFGNLPDITYSDWFAIYPWMLDKNYEYVVMNSMATGLGLDEVKELRPQSTPGIVPRPLIRRFIDRPLLAALLERWQHRYQTKTPTWEDTALFRSLNMANAASKIPASADGTNYDIGRTAGLWVSAFEVLVHNGKDKSGRFKVYENFDKALWNLTKCKEKKYEAHGHQEGQPLRNLACWIYGKVHSARNDFLHGNPVTVDTLLISESGRYLLHYAPVLYRMALTGILDLKWDEEPPTAEEGLDIYESKKFDFVYFQGDMEAALATALQHAAKTPC